MIIKALGLALIGAALAASSALAQGKKWETVRIATEGAYAPWNFSGPGGKLDGYEIDLAHDLCARMKVKCEIVAQDWDGIIPALQAGKYDAIMAGMNITEKRLEVLNFSRSYGGEPAGFGVPKDGPLAKLPDDGVRFDLTKDEAGAVKEIEKIKPMLKGKAIGVQVSTIHSNFLDKYLKGTIDIREYKTTEQHDLDLLAGRIDGIFASGSAIRATFDKPDFKDYTMAGPRFSGGVFGRGVAVGLRKTDPELQKMFDDAIAAAIADGTLKKLSVKWFKSDISPES
jgi:octopine/nopaline transport system substrate-binding protein